MSCIPTASSSTSVGHTALATGKRALTLLVTLATAVALLLVPQFNSAASAAPTALTGATGRILARNMLVVLNAERRAHRLPPLSMNSKLILSAHRHNAAMAHANTMAHQLPHEAFFASRISSAGYKWQVAGENIGWNSSMTNAGLRHLEYQMYNEKLPGDIGHRLNILSRSYRQVGIDVYFDKPHNKMWFTQDFGRP